MILPDKVPPTAPRDRPAEGPKPRLRDIDAATWTAGVSPAPPPAPGRRCVRPRHRGFPDRPVRETGAAAPQCLRGRLQRSGAGLTPTSGPGLGPLTPWMRNLVSATHGTRLCTWL